MKHANARSASLRGCSSSRWCSLSNASWYVRVLASAWGLVFPVRPKVYWVLSHRNAGAAFPARFGGCGTIIRRGLGVGPDVSRASSTSITSPSCESTMTNEMFSREKPYEGALPFDSSRP